MKFRRPIMLLPYLPARRTRALSLAAHRHLLPVLVAVLAASAFGKDAPTAAIVLFDGVRGPAYIQLTGATLNGKTEVRICDGVSAFDKAAYNAMPRISFAAASSLQRESDGRLTLTVDGKRTCVVPSNLKFDRKSQFTPAEAAEQAALQGIPVPAGSADIEIPPLRPGVQIVFVAAPDFELADFLRAQRTNSIKDWQEFLTHHPSSSRVMDVQRNLAALHETAGEAAWVRYQQSGNGGNRDLGLARQAYAEAQAANQAVTGYEPALKLTSAIERDLDQLLQSDRAGLQAFQKALQDRTGGYAQLASARAHVEELLTVQPDYSPSVALRRDIGREDRKLEAAVANAESLKASARFDEALSALGPYSCLAPEIPRIDAIESAAYRYHFDRGDKFDLAQQWEQAIDEFRAALAIRPDSKQATAALNNATAELGAQHDQEQLKNALAKSNEYAEAGQYVEAYELLANLPENQRTLVASQLSALQSNYVSAALRRAQQVQGAHVPIRSRADEDAVREACDLLGRVGSITSDPALALRHDFLSSKLSAYYLDQANRYLQKPSGAGAGMGWLYLKQAESYGVTNLDNIRDLMAKYAAAYQRRAQLSLGITFLDQTSRHDGPGFADQLADAIASRLESSGTGVVVVRTPSNSSDALPPNFMLVGEVLDHRVVKSETVEAPQSKYRAGVQEVKNPSWLQAQANYDAARQQLVATQQALLDAESQHKKKELLAAASDAAQGAQKQVDDARRALETTDQNLSQQIIETYHYTKKVVDLTASIELVFHVSDLSGRVIGQPVSIHKDNHKSVVIVQDVKPEDIEGVTNQNVEPDETQFLTDLEIQARDAMAGAVQDKVSSLPGQFLEEARDDVQRGDLDAAAEQYVMYLNSTSGTAPGRDEAVSFLRDRFHLAAPAPSKS